MLARLALRSCAAWLAVAVLLAGLAACATQPKRPAGSGTGYYKVGNPYQIAGVWYYPKEDPFYDETGIASWYGPDFHGKSTANGELYDMDTLTAAHRTLPMPTIVRVTNLENGRSIRVRVNDRGPYARGRIIDLSRRAAELLGFQTRGTARVRVQFEGRAEVGGAPPDASVASSGPVAPEVRAAPLGAVSAQEIAPPAGALSSPLRATAPLPSQASSKAVDLDAPYEPDGKVTQVAVPGATQLWVQVGAFLSRGNADRLAARLYAVGPTRVTTSTQNGKPVYRVRFGPFMAVEQADAMLDKVIGAGQNGAQIVVE